MSRIKKFRDLFDIKPIILNTKSLNKLEKILKENPDTDELKIEITDAINRWEIDSFADLDTICDIPDITNKLSIRMWRWEDINGTREIICSIDISMYVNHVECHISSTNKTWLLGKKTEILEFCNKNQPWYGPIKPFIPFTSALIVVFFATTYYFIMNKHLVYGLASLFASLFLFYINSQSCNDSILPYVKIVFREVPETKNNLIKFGAIVSIISGLVSIYKFLLEVLS